MSKYFSELWTQVNRISEKRVDFDWDTVTRPEPIDIELDTGKEIALEELKVMDGLLTVQGRQVLLYIPDQGFRYTLAEIQEDPRNGRRYHVADCSTLDDMRGRKRFE